MDANQPKPPPEQNTPAPASPPATPPEKKPVPDAAPKSGSKKIFLIVGGLLIFILLGMLLSASFKKPADTDNKVTNATVNENKPEKSVTPTTPPAKKVSQLMVYGVWTGQTSAIKAVNLSNSSNILLATLPLKIKKVHVLTDKELLYIDQVDNQNYGTRVIIYNMQTESVSTRIPAADGFVLNDYILSPDKKYLAMWEVRLSASTQILQGGQSRVYAIDLSRPPVKRLLYDEKITTVPIHYPRAILNNGTVFADTFIPNDPNGDEGWAYGMSIVDFDGTNKKLIETMPAGTYGTQPTLSHDGKYLLFAGYDGANGDGKEIINGQRQALLTPNTVELLNTQSLKRFRLPNLNHNTTYTAASWDPVTGNVIIKALSDDTKKTGLFSYDLAEKKPKKINLPENQSTYGFISQLPEGKTLIATSDESASNLGNLGETSAYALTQLSILDAANSISNLTVQDPFIQYITIRPATYFSP